MIEGRPHIVDLIKNGEIAYIVNTTEGKQAIADSFSIRREALQQRVTYSTTIAGAKRAAAFARIPRHRPGLGAAGTAQGTRLATSTRNTSGDGMRAPLTLKGAQRLRAELDELKSVKRPAVIQAIAEARAHGDLKENAEYHAAREQQGFIEGRIKQLEARAVACGGDRRGAAQCGLARRVRRDRDLADVETDDEKRYQIVGDLEADIKQGLIAISSPVARALIGKHEGDSVTIEAPGGHARVRDRRRRYAG